MSELFSDLKNTHRGFRYYEFFDHYGELCTLQKSSLATEDAVWLGVNKAFPKKLVQNQGWVIVDLPEDVEISSRMHLTRQQAKVLAKQLNYFSETGELPAIALSDNGEREYIAKGEAP